MKIIHSDLNSVVHKLMSEMGVMNRPATPGEITRICQAVLDEAEGRKAQRLAPKPLAPKLVVPENPDEASAKEALFTVYAPWVLERRLREIPGCYFCGVARLCPNPFVVLKATFASQDAIREVLSDFGVCPPRRKAAPRYMTRPGRCLFTLTVRLPNNWRLEWRPAAGSRLAKPRQKEREHGHEPQVTNE